MAIQDLPFILLRMTCILTLALNYHYFCLFVYDVFTQGPLNICQAITIKGDSVSSVSVSNALDQFLRQGVLEANKLFDMGSWSNITYTIFGFSILLSTLIFSALAMGLIMLAKIASVIILSLSPIFIFFAMFDATKGLFDSYISQLVTYSLVPIMTCAVLMIILSVAQSVMGDMDSASKPSLSSLVPYFLSCLAQIWLMPQIQSKCAALASGFSLKGFVSTLQGVGNNMRAAGSMAMGGDSGRRLLRNAASLVTRTGTRSTTIQMNRYRRPE